MIKIGDKTVGPGQSTYVIGEIGINHNGCVDTAKRIIDAAVVAGCDAVKFQKRTPDLCVPSHQRDVQRETPWGIMSYIDYKWKVGTAWGISISDLRGRGRLTRVELCLEVDSRTCPNPGAYRGPCPDAYVTMT